MREEFVYAREHLALISFPIGGIGNVCAGRAGNGHRKDRAILNGMAKRSDHGLKHFSVKVEDDSTVHDAEARNGDLNPPYTGPFGGPTFFEGCAWGPLRETLAGMPHFPRSLCTQWSYGNGQQFRDSCGGRALDCSPLVFCAFGKRYLPLGLRTSGINSFKGS
jgi:hypothetical protein